MSAIAQYYDGMDSIKEDSGNPDIFKISPSSVADFFTATSQYYREQVLGEEKAFQGSTATHLGIIIHHCAEISANQGDTSTFESDIEEFLATITDPEIDKDAILSNWFGMASILVTEGVLNRPDDFIETEQFIYTKLNDDVYVGGTYDALVTDPANPDTLRVVDWKTAATKPSSFNFKYKLQAFTYAWMLRESGRAISSVELSFTVRPTKTLPARYFQFVEPYTDQTHDYIGGILNLIAESVSKFKSTPELRHLLSQDMRLKQGKAPAAFPSA